VNVLLINSVSSNTLSLISLGLVFITKQCVESLVMLMPFITGNKSRRRIVTIRIPLSMNKELEEFARKFNYPSKSELVRAAILEFLAEIENEMKINIHFGADNDYLEDDGGLSQAEGIILV